MRQKQHKSSQATGIKTESWLAKLKNVPVVTTPSLGLGQDLRVDGEGIIGSGLFHEESLVYLSVFARVEGNEQGMSGSRMARASQRGVFNR